MLRLAHKHMVGTVIGKYRIVGSLGRGATGVVYRAVDETLGREVAIKILSSEVAESEVMKRFRTEATALAKLNHHGIATIYELFSSGSDLLMVMEFVPGQTLEHLSDREGPMAPVRAAYLVDRLLSALEHAHRAGIVHRDMKPANVMVGHAGAVKIMDFGIARVRGVEHITGDGCMMGTPAYMAPEHVRGEEVDERADLYAVGVILYRLLTGRLPFNADTTVVMLQKQISDPPTALHKYRTDLPPWCESIVQRAMAKLPEERFQTASEFRTALGRAAGAAPEASHPEYAHGADHDDGFAQIRPRTTTMVLSRKAAKAIRRAARSASGVRQSTFPASQWPMLLSLSGFAASLVFLVYVTAHRTATAHRARPAAAPVAAAAAPKDFEPAVEPQVVVPASVKTTYPVLVFAAKGLAGSSREQRERDVRLVLGGQRITVTDDATRQRLQAVAYEDVSAIAYSHGRDPMWNSGNGPAPIARTSGRFSRALGFSVRRHWIALMTRTDRRLVILRVTDAQVGDVLSALEERTGRTPQLMESRKGAD